MMRPLLATDWTSPSTIEVRQRCCSWLGWQRVSTAALTPSIRLQFLSTLTGNGRDARLFIICMTKTTFWFRHSPHDTEINIIMLWQQSASVLSSNQMTLAVTVLMWFTASKISTGPRIWANLLAFQIQTSKHSSTDNWCVIFNENNWLWRW